MSSTRHHPGRRFLKTEYVRLARRTEKAGGRIEAAPDPLALSHPSEDARPYGEVLQLALWQGHGCDGRGYQHAGRQCAGERPGQLLPPPDCPHGQQDQRPAGQPQDHPGLDAAVRGGSRDFSRPDRPDPGVRLPASPGVSGQVPAQGQARPAHRMGGFGQWRHRHPGRLFSNLQS